MKPLRARMPRWWTALRAEAARLARASGRPRANGDAAAPDLTPPRGRDPDDFLDEPGRPGLGLLKAGRIEDGVAVLARQMEAQARAAAAAGVPSDTRYLGKRWTRLIGHISLIDVVVKRQLLGLSSADRYVLVDNPKCQNPAYLDRWRAWLDVVPEPDGAGWLSERIRLAEDYPTILWLDGRWQWLYDAVMSVQRRWDESGRGPLLALTEPEIERGRDRLRELGVPDGAWFVTVHVRDSRSSPLRNAEIGAYEAAVRRIVEEGGWVVRLGDSAMTPLPRIQGLVDYATSGARADWMDVFLLAQPRFFVGTNSGPAFAAATFGVPAVLTNWMPIGIGSHYANTIVLFKRVRCARSGRLLTFEEQLREPAISLTDAAASYEEVGVVAEPSRPDELVAGVEEMLQRTGGTWAPDPADDERQRRFEELARRFEARGRSRVGRAFLAEHAELLEEPAER